MQDLFDRQTGSDECDYFGQPQCCGTGCTVCVLDYPEMFRNQKSDSELLAMLEAVEQAQKQAREIIADASGDHQ